MTKLWASLAALAVIAVVGGTAWSVLNRGSDPFASCRQSQIAGGADTIGGPFELVDQTGKTVTDKDVITKPTLVYFGYTFCADVCPVDNARNAEVTDILEERGIDVTPVFITVDPKRDTTQVMADYVANMHPRMIGLTGSAYQIAAATRAYKVYFKANEGDPDFYLVDHTTFTYLMLPGRGFADFYRREATPDQMAESVSCFVGAA
ncbi:MAG: SCO family protein [Cereibacter sphaeroides]|uniref:SCO family protein n=1 Tax=Cereibacter sphaeroides TaxID=1063 RepID=A0A2W5S3Z2_CERSP|nr:MAG: SCO family protein [Cereibacter sphaeroides]